MACATGKMINTTMDSVCERLSRCSPPMWGRTVFMIVLSILMFTVPLIQQKTGWTRDVHDSTDRWIEIPSPPIANDTDSSWRMVPSTAEWRDIFLDWTLDFNNVVKDKPRSVLGWSTSLFFCTDVLLVLAAYQYVNGKGGRLMRLLCFAGVTHAFSQMILWFPNVVGSFPNATSMNLSAYPSISSNLYVAPSCGLMSIAIVFQFLVVYHSLFVYYRETGYQRPAFWVGAAHLCNVFLYQIAMRPSHTSQIYASLMFLLLTRDLFPSPNDPTQSMAHYASSQPKPTQEEKRISMPPVATLTLLERTYKPLFDDPAFSDLTIRFESTQTGGSRISFDPPTRESKQKASELAELLDGHDRLRVSTPRGSKRFQAARHDLQESAMFKVGSDDEEEDFDHDEKKEDTRRPLLDVPKLKLTGVTASNESEQEEEINIEPRDPK
jgi:hypothetical protein